MKSRVTFFLLQTLARVQEYRADKEGLDEVFVEHLPDLGAGGIENVSLRRSLRSDKFIAVADLFFPFISFFFQGKYQRSGDRVSAREASDGEQFETFFRARGTIAVTRHITWCRFTVARRLSFNEIAGFQNRASGRLF